MNRDAVKTLTEMEATVLYWVCGGLKYREIGDKMSCTDQRVGQIMDGVYEKLGTDTSAHWSKRRDQLEREEYCVELNALIDGKPENLKKFPLVAPPLKPPIKQERPRSVPRWILGAVVAALIVIAAILGLTSYFRPEWLSRSVSLTQAPVMPVSATNAPIPVPDHPGIFLSLVRIDEVPFFHDCVSPTPGFGLAIRVDNRSKDAFTLTYDPTGFHAQDNLGNRYPFEGSGVERCDDSPTGKQVAIPGQQSRAVLLIFSGQIPPQTREIYLIVEGFADNNYILERDAPDVLPSK